MQRGLKILFAVLVAMLAWGAQLASASASSVGYTVKAELPSDQLSKQVSYFDLHTQPGQQQQLKVVISNTSNTTQRFAVSVNQAVTNDNGVIDYSQSDPKLDPTLQVGMKELFTKASGQRVTVPANSQKTVVLTLQMPEKTVRGTLLGGVYVAQLQGKAAKPKVPISIRNAFAYAIGVELREGALVKPNLVLHQVRATQLNRRNFITANLQNPEPGIMSGLKVNAQVMKAGQSQLQPLISQQQSHMGMAPNSNFNFAIPWGNKDLPAGQYILHLTAQAGKQNWQFTRNFTIAKKTVKRLNKTVITPTKRPNYWLYLVLGLIIVALLAVIGYLIYRNRQQRKSLQ